VHEMPRDEPPGLPIEDGDALVSERCERVRAEGLQCDHEGGEHERPEPRTHGRTRQSIEVHVWVGVRSERVCYDSCNLPPATVRDMTFARTSTAPRRTRGFTLIEIMVVVVILGILAALVAPNVIRRIDDARVTKAKQDIRAYETALNLYRMDNFRYPNTEQGLQALVTRPADPNVRNWKDGGYIDGLKKDPWGYDYAYIAPGTRGEYDLYTLGADGQPGGEGPDADIGNWTIE
jgi:general secretion pathway protein G